ncbi:MAG: hypothetical protein SNJ75_19845, partial [Gemmataceae bacterium]
SAEQVAGEPTDKLAEEPQAEAASDEAVAVHAEAAPARIKKTRTKATKSKTRKTVREGSETHAAEEAPVRPRRRKKVASPSEETPEVSEALVGQSIEELAEGTLVASTIPETPLPAQDEDSTATIAEVQPIAVDVPAVNVGEGVLEVVEHTETVEITTVNFVTREAAMAPSEVAVVSPSDATEKADKSESEKKRKRRRRRGKGRSRDEVIAPRTIEAAKGRTVRDEDDADEEVVGETGGGVVPAVEEDDEVEFIDLSDLQVPSWPELVASLYRPPDR